MSIRNWTISTVFLILLAWPGWGRAQSTITTIHTNARVQCSQKGGSWSCTEAIPSPTPTPAANLALSPKNGAIVSCPVMISCFYLSRPTSSWVNLLLDGTVLLSGTGPEASVSTVTTSGAHSIACQGWHWNSTTNSGVLDITQTNSITVAGPGTPTPSLLKEKK